MTKSIRKTKTYLITVVSVIALLLMSSVGTASAYTYKGSTDQQQVLAVQAAMVKAGTMNPVEGINRNVITIAQQKANSVASGVKVTIASTANARIAADGTITYGSTAVTGYVNFKLTKNSASVVQAVKVYVPKSRYATYTTAPTTTTPTAPTTTTPTAPTTTTPTAPTTTVPTTPTVTAPITNTYATYAGTSVPAGSISVKNYGAVGNGSTDDTAAIQKTLDYVGSIGGGTVYIPDGTYMINVTAPLKPKSNTTVYLASKAVLKAKANSLAQFSIMTIKDATNVKVMGGSVVGDRNEHLGTSGESGMGIVVAGSTNVTISDITTRDCWGDGIYVGNSGLKTYSENVIIERFVSDNNRRQGISIISVKGLIIRNGTVSNTHGTAPECGIDLEPNNVNQFMQKVLIENVTAINNNLYGLGFGYYIYQNSTVPSDVTVKNLIASGNKAGAYNDYTKYVDQYCKVTFI